MRIKYQIIKARHRLVKGANQKLSDLVKHEKFIVWDDKDKAIETVMDNAEPGTNFQFMYSPKDENPYKYIAIGQIGRIDCDDFLLPDESLDVERLRAEVTKELSKEFDFSHDFYSEEKAQQMYDDLKRMRELAEQEEREKRAKKDEDDENILY